MTGSNKSSGSQSSTILAVELLRKLYNVDKKTREELIIKVSCKFEIEITTGRWISPGTPDSSTNKTDRYAITEILLKVAISIINLTKTKIEIELHDHQESVSD